MATSTTPIEQVHIRYKDTEFTYLTQGQGPVVLLVHGFPDIPHTWSAQLSALASEGYQVVAPFLPGYMSTHSGQPVYFDKASLVNYFTILIEALSPQQKVFYVGQDWGAIIGYALCAARPELVASAVVMAVPHPELVSTHLLVPRHIHRSFHWWFFQQPELPEKALLENEMAFIDYLWQYWTAPGYQDPEHLKQVKSYLKRPGVLSNALAYYRAMFNDKLADPTLEALRSRMSTMILTPTLAMCGADDMRAELMRDQSAYFGGDYEYVEVSDAGHFLQREQSPLVNNILIGWLRKSR